MAAKPWPKDNEPEIGFSELIEPVRKALEAAYKLERTDQETVPYDGWDFTSAIKACSDPILSLTDKEWQEYDRDQGRDILDGILHVAFSLGFEQGRRNQRQEWSIYKRLAEG